MLLPNHLILKKTNVYRSWLIGFLGWAGDAAENPELLDCRTHAPGKSLFLLHVPTNNHFSASRAPPGFSCPCFIHFMKITVFITIVTPNGLLNFMILSISLQFPNYQKNKENMNSLFFVSISIVLSSWAPPMHMFVPLKCSKKCLESAAVQQNKNSDSIPKTHKIALCVLAENNVKTIVFHF